MIVQNALIALHIRGVTRRLVGLVGRGLRSRLFTLGLGVLDLVQFLDESQLRLFHSQIRV